jgi:hypothetical protein
VVAIWSSTHWFDGERSVQSMLDIATMMPAKARKMTPVSAV